MKTTVTVIALAASFLLVGCSGAPEPTKTLEPPTNAQDFSLPKYVPTKKPTDLGDGPTVAKPGEVKKVVDKGLEISLPSTQSIDVKQNEKLKITTSGLQPKKDVKAVIFYYSNGNNNATLELGKTKTDDSGSVILDVTIPSELAAGKYSIAFTSDEGIANAPIVVK